MRSAANSLLKLACTYSIVARDPQTGELGVADGLLGQSGPVLIVT